MDFDPGAATNFTALMAGLRNTLRVVIVGWLARRSRRVHRDRRLRQTPAADSIRQLYRVFRKPVLVHSILSTGLRLGCRKIWQTRTRCPARSTSTGARSTFR